MEDPTGLGGSCSCGRFQYAVLVPSDASARSQAQVHFGTGSADRRSQASLLTAWLRVPLPWYRSSTVSFFPDETHNHIAKTFVPVDEPACQRKFCGFCGTHLTYWTEDPEDEKDFMNVTLGSLGARDLHALDQLGLLPNRSEESSPGQTASPKGSGGDAESRLVAPQLRDTVERSKRSGQTGGITWFEEMIRGSELGHHSNRRKGHGQSADGTTTVMWEVSEYFEDHTDENNDKKAAVDQSSAGAEDTTTGAKRRKIEIEDHDSDMKD